MLSELAKPIYQRITTKSSYLEKHAHVRLFGFHQSRS